MSVTLQSTKEPHGLSIEFAEEPVVQEYQAELPAEHVVASALMAEAKAIVAVAQPLIDAARLFVDLARQREEQAEIGEIRAEIGDTRAMIRGIAEELEAMRRPLRTLASAPHQGAHKGRPYGPALEVLESDPLFIDYETTGLSKHDRVVEVAVVDAEGRVALSTLVNPGVHIPAEATAVNGVSDADVADAPTWEQIAPELERLIAGRAVVAHNAKFEAKWTPETWGVRWVCSKELADQALGKAEYWEVMHDRLLGGGLDARLYQCGLQPGPEHSAAGDCISALRLLRYLAGETSPVELMY